MDTEYMEMCLPSFQIELFESMNEFEFVAPANILEYHDDRSETIRNPLAGFILLTIWQKFESTDIIENIKESWLEPEELELLGDQNESSLPPDELANLRARMKEVDDEVLGAWIQFYRATLRNFAK